MEVKIHNSSGNTNIDKIDPIPTPKHADIEEYADSTKEQFVKSVSSKHRVLMRHILAGRTNKEAAEIVGYGPDRVSFIINSPLFQAEMERMRVDIEKGVVELESEVAHMDGGVNSKLREESLASLETIISLRDGAQSERVKQVSALEILDRAGYSKTEKVHNTVELDVSDGLLNAIQTAMKEMGKPKPTNVSKESNGDTK